ncbi:hypothetical protein L1987_19509 [Smallanthus sonchifolius]|uniref:Uncharacterized protein n=1 Tax=Smallanthus sonchifolius TaxID=185202 RepID=A0ACB9IQX5_9ASTR|nr:hypothetical protein L1987_19509 [Smallanthus sonchifolius]
MYRHSPVRNQRLKGVKIKHVVQVCLLVAVCFWLIFQVKRSHDKKKEFDANNSKISLNTHADEIVKFGRKDLQPKLDETTALHEDTQEQEDEQEENKHDEEEQDEDKIEEEKDDGGGGGDDEIDENEQEKSNMEIDRDEVDIIDEDKETEESEEKEIEEKDGQIQTENGVDHEEDGSTEHTNEAREEHYKADDASSAVISHDPGNEIKNQTLDDNSSENVGLVENGENENGSIIQEKESESMNATSAGDFHENGPPPNTTTTSTGYQFDSNATVTEITQGFSKLTENSEMLKSNESTGDENSSDQSISENLETNNEDSSDPTHLEEKEVRNDLETLPDIETEGDHSTRSCFACKDQDACILQLNLSICSR